MPETKLNPTDCLTILKNCYGDKHFEVLDSETKPLSENVEGFLGEHYKVTINFKMDETLSTGYFFMKTMPSGKIQTELCTEFRAYEKEIFLYQTLFEEFQKRGYNTDFAAKCYLCKDHKTLILEDLNKSGYTLSERKQPHDLHRCEALLRSLALFHGNGFMYEEAKSKETGRTYRLSDDFGYLFKEVMYSENKYMCSYFKTVKDFLLIAIDLLDEEDTMKEDFKKLVNATIVREMFNREINCRKIIGHGDLWSNNMMFLVSNNITTKCILLDYQVLRYYCPGLDVMIAIMQNTTSAFRNKYLEYLIHYYYAQLSDNLKQHGFEVEKIMPIDDFIEGVEKSRFLSLHHGLWTHMYTYLPPSFINKIVQGGDKTLEENLNGGNLHVHVEAFKNDSLFREVVTDDIYEIYRSLKTLEDNC